MQFGKVFYRYVTTPGGPATVAMGADSAPTTVFAGNAGGAQGKPPQNQYNPNLVPAGNVDNTISTRMNGQSAPVAVTRIGVTMLGPAGAALPTANLYVFDDGVGYWYLINAAPITLQLNQVVFFDALSICEPPPGMTQVSQGGTDYMLVVIPNGSPTAGIYAFTMTALLGIP